MALPTQAAVEPDPEAALIAPPAAKASAAKSEKIDASVASTKRGERRRASIRCWQEGRLVYQGSIVAPTTRGSAAIEIRSADIAEGSLQFLHLKSGLCLVESLPRP